MRIWKKLALVTSGIFLVSFLGVEGAAMIQTGKYTVSQAVENGKEELKKTVMSIEKEKMFYGAENWSEAVEKSFYTYALDKYGGEGYLILKGNQEICNFSQYQIRENDWETGYAVQSWQQKLDGKNLVVLSRTLRYGNNPKESYGIFLIQDISSIYQDMIRRGILFGGISLVMAAFAAFLVFLVVRRMMKPLDELKKAAEGIGRGDLKQRVQVSRMDEIGTVAQAFNQMSDQIQKQVQELEDVAGKRKQLLGSLAHEMKTPMTSIIGYSDTLLKVTLNEEQKKKALQYIREEGKRLERLSGKLMGLIGLYENEAFQWELRSVGELLERVTKIEEESLKQKNMKLVQTCTMGQRRMDMDLMESLLINLVDNAIRASEEGGTIDILASGTTITVRDFGRGIPECELERVTEAFYMVDKSRSRKSGGVGLGLALCRQIAELHGASLSISSILGEGTSVSVVFAGEDYKTFTSY